MLKLQKNLFKTFKKLRVSVIVIDNAHTVLTKVLTSGTCQHSHWLRKHIVSVIVDYAVSDGTDFKGTITINKILGCVYILKFCVRVVVVVVVNWTGLSLTWINGHCETILCKHWQLVIKTTAHNSAVEKNSDLLGSASFFGNLIQKMSSVLFCLKNSVSYTKCGHWTARNCTQIRIWIKIKIQLWIRNTGVQLYLQCSLSSFSFWILEVNTNLKKSPIIGITGRIDKIVPAKTSLCSSSSGNSI